MNGSTKQRSPASHALRLGTAGAIVCLAGLGGCRRPVTQVNVLSLRDPSAPRSYFSRFDESYFRFDSHGNLDLVLRGRNEGDPERPGGAEVITEVVHVRAFWTPVPGKTFANASMINARARYTILTEAVGIAYEGAGFVSFRLDRKKRKLTGKLEAAQLTPVVERGDARDLFGPAQVTGEFLAHKDERQVIRILNEVRILLEPPPPSP